MKRSGFLRRVTPLRVKGHSDTATVKEEIQKTVRAIVIARDGGCIMRDLHYFDFPECGGYRKDGELILQADHLVTRSNSATFADTRLIVCVCKAHHGWKSVGSNLRKFRYDGIVRDLISEERVALWDRCEEESWKAVKMNWQVELAAVKQELSMLQSKD